MQNSSSDSTWRARWETHDMDLRAAVAAGLLILPRDGTEPARLRRGVIRYGRDLPALERARAIFGILSRVLGAR